jgi:gliding motility-associated-like protein
VFSLNFLTVYSQLDREHWFAPMMSRNDQGIQYQTLYMSTSDETPFNVDIYNNNTVIGSVMISKGNPGKFDVPRQYIITTEADSLFVVGTMGLYLKGEKPFFANLRFSNSNHAEIVTSKAGAGLGTTFRVVMAPKSPDTFFAFGNLMTSVIATEDNTTVTINEFNPNTIFSDGNIRTEFNFTLNKGESYIIETIAAIQYNYTGAKIVSNKPISITNGNFNGQYVNMNDGSDILMDQSVPVEKLGQEFVLVKGNGPVSGNGAGMERALIVATEDNTEIYLNGSTTPETMLNTGEYFMTPIEAYISQSPEHYNMYVAASKNIYVYQLLAGAGNDTPDVSTTATGGMNFIPPLGCYLPKKIDEIGLIDENRVVLSSPPLGDVLNIPTKLNIITQRGANIEVKSNGNSLTLNSENGPFDVSGNDDWITYSIPNIFGNVAITSTRAVTAGISAGNGAVGYGGYFAGFSSKPEILKSVGECLEDGEVRLEVIEGFTSYQWLKKNALGGYDPIPGANDYFYIPSESGIYAVIIQQEPCDPIQTEDFKFFNCTTYTDTDYDICTTIDITPIFFLSPQTPNPTTVNIDTPPTKGNVVINANGSITYTAFPNETGIDTFKYSFCGNGTIPDCEIVQATIHLHQIEKYDATLRECSSTAIATYDLSLAAVTPNTDVSKVYYHTQQGAENQDPADVIPNFNNYTSADGFVYVRMLNTFGCVAIAKIELQYKPNPVVAPELYTEKICDENIDEIIDGVYKLDVTTITPFVLANFTDFDVKYYADQTSAEAGGTDNITGIFSFTQNTSVWIRVESSENCITVKEIFLTVGDKLQLLTNSYSDALCDDDLDGIFPVDLSVYKDIFNPSPTAIATYHASFNDAIENKNPLSNPVTVEGTQTFWIRFSEMGICSEIGVLTITIKIPKTSDILVDQGICPGATTILDAGSGFDYYKWMDADGNVIAQGTNVTEITVGIGTYFVELTFDGCSYTQKVVVFEADLPIITLIEIDGTTIIVHVSGGNPPYLYSLDGEHFQTSNIFTNVPYGENTVYVISAENCEPAFQVFYIIRIPNVVTPNGDGYNDFVDLSDLMFKEDVNLKIYDHQGALIFIGERANSYIWDGKMRGKPIPTKSYWYVLEYRNPGMETIVKSSGWILVKNRN